MGPVLAQAQTLLRKPVRLLPAGKPVGSVLASRPAPVFSRPATMVYPINPLAPNAYYDQHFGFFCKQEWTWQKHTGVPVKLRLGNYDYTQRYEGK